MNVQSGYHLMGQSESAKGRVSSVTDGALLRLHQPRQHDPRVIAVTSGKGGVGKSVIAANVGVALARQGRRVLLVDADLALANLDLMLGVTARSTVADVLSNHVRIEDAVVQGPAGVSLLAACSGDENLAEIDAHRRSTLFSAIDALESRFDTVIVDTGAGVGSNATFFAAAAQQVLVVVTPDPASMADAYAMIKVLNKRRGVKRAHLVVNLASGPAEAEHVVQRLVDLTAQFLDLALIPVGFIYRDEAVRRCVRRCEPVVSAMPRSAVAASISALATRVTEENPGPGSGGPAIFWKRLMGISEDAGSQ